MNTAASHSFHAPDRRVTRESVPTLRVAPGTSIYVCGYLGCSSPSIDGSRCARHLGLRPTPVPTIGHVHESAAELRARCVRELCAMPIVVRCMPLSAVTEGL